MKPVYKAKDGTEHASEQAALLRNELIEAVKEFDELGTRVRCLLGANALTADGVPCDLRYRTKYWAVRFWEDTPRIIEVEVWYSDFGIDLDTYHGQPRLVLRVRDHYGQSPQQDSRWPINELYADKRAAQAKMAEMLDERIAEMQKKAQALRDN